MAFYKHFHKNPFGFVDVFPIPLEGDCYPCFMDKQSPGEMKGCLPPALSKWAREEAGAIKPPLSSCVAFPTPAVPPGKSLGVLVYLPVTVTQGNFPKGMELCVSPHPCQEQRDHSLGKRNQHLTDNLLGTSREFFCGWEFVPRTSRADFAPASRMARLGSVWNEQSVS